MIVSEIGTRKTQTAINGGHITMVSFQKFLIGIGRRIGAGFGGGTFASRRRCALGAGQ